MKPREWAVYLAAYFVSDHEPGRQEFMRYEVLRAIHECMSQVREECARMADEYGAGTEGSITLDTNEFERRYGKHETLGDAIRAMGEKDHA